MPWMESNKVHKPLRLSFNASVTSTDVGTVVVVAAVVVVIVVVHPGNIKEKAVNRE